MWKMSLTEVVKKSVENTTVAKYDKKSEAIALPEKAPMAFVHKEEETEASTVNTLLPECWKRILSNFDLKGILSKRSVSLKLQNVIDQMLHENCYRANERLWSPYFQMDSSSLFENFNGIPATRFRSYDDIPKFLEQMESLRTLETSTPLPTGRVIFYPKDTWDFFSNPCELYNHFLKFIELYGKYIVSLVYYTPVLSVDNGAALFAKGLEKIFLHCENLVNLVVFYDREMETEYSSAGNIEVINSLPNCSFPKSLCQLQIHEINYRPNNDQDSMIIALRNLKGVTKNLTHFRFDWHPSSDIHLTEENSHLFNMPNLIKLKVKMFSPKILEIFQNSEGEAAFSCLRQLSVRLSDECYWVGKGDKDGGERSKCLLGGDLDVVGNIRQLFKILDESYADKLKHLDIDYRSVNKRSVNEFHDVDKPLGNTVYPNLKHFVISFEAWLQLEDLVVNMLRKLPNLEKLTISVYRTWYDTCEDDNHFLVRNEQVIKKIWRNASLSLKEIDIQGFKRTFKRGESN